MISAEQIDRWIREPSENRTLEFKQASNSFDEYSLFRYCAAIANEGGGHLVLGVTDRPPRVIVGSRAFSNIVAIEEKLLVKLRFRVEAHEVACSGGRVVVFEIPARPRGSAYAVDGAYWMRSGSSLVVMSEDRLRSIFAEGESHWGEGFCKTALSHESVIDFLDTQTFFELLQQPYPTTRAAVIDRLVAERLIVVDAAGINLKRIAALLLAKDLTVFPELARKAVRLIVYEGTSKVAIRSRTIESRGYAVGFRSLVERVMLQVARREHISTALRIEETIFPETGIRELVANALVHQDLTLTGMSPTIEIYDNRLEISNAGEPLVAVERFIDGYRTRNEQVGEWMRRMRICEELGSGVDRLVTLAEERRLPPPLFQKSPDRTMVVIYGPATFKDMSRLDRIRACYQHCVLKYVRAEHMTNPSLRTHFGLAESKMTSVSGVIGATLEAGLIVADESVGESRRYARYLPFWA